MTQITTTTKRLIVFGIVVLGIITSIGWIAGSIASTDALVIVNGIITGGFALVKT